MVLAFAKVGRGRLQFSLAANLYRPAGQKSSLGTIKLNGVASDLLLRATEGLVLTFLLLKACTTMKNNADCADHASNLGSQAWKLGRCTCYLDSRRATRSPENEDPDTANASPDQYS